MTDSLARPTAPRRPARTILVVDDEEVVRMLVNRALGEAGYAVVEASHGPAALALPEPDTHELDLVVCDLGHAGPQRTRSGPIAECLPARPPGPVISGYPRPYLEAHDLCDPGIPLLRKPFLPSRLLDVVEESLVPARARSPKPTGAG